MSDLPLDLRKLLEDRARQYTTEHLESLKDGKGTVKLRLKCSDGFVVETVILEDKTGRRTACLSSQAGCAMGCAFCKTGTLGLSRQLETHEIVEQFLHARKQDETIGNIVFMGMGEPLANFENLMKAVRILHEPSGCGLGYKRITVSTCGLSEGIERLALETPSVRLALSLITADQGKRESLIPAARTNTLPRLKKSLLAFQKEKESRITLEYVLLKGINDGRDEVRKLLEFIRGLDCLINIIPWNPVKGLPFERPESVRTEEFVRALRSEGISVTRRMTRGVSINSACGQLGGIQ